jgi:glycogen synthase
MAMRVLILSWEYPPIVEGGLARHVRKLAEGLVAEGVEVHVLTRGAAGGAAEEERRGVRVHRVAEPGWPAALDRFVLWVGQMNADMREAGEALFARHDFDVVHGHDWLVASAAVRLSERFGAPYLTTIHATEHGRHHGWVDSHPQAHIHGIETWMARRADQVVVCSHYMRDHVADVFGVGEDRVAVVPNGVDPLELRPVGDLAALRARFAAPEERLVLLVGRLVHEKGFQLALEALGGADGLGARSDLRFVVAGSGPYEAELRAQARRLGIAERGTFLGWIGDDLLHSLYRVADLTVVPSFYEPFGLVALEAIASGCPCIVADTGGLREVVPSVGLRFRPRDPAALAEMIDRVLVDDERRDRLVAQAAEHVLRYDWADVARRTAELYAALAPAPARVD